MLLPPMPLSHPQRSVWLARSSVLVVVVALHLLVLFSHFKQPAAAQTAPKEMSVNIAWAQPVASFSRPQPRQQAAAVVPVVEEVAPLQPAQPPAVAPEPLPAAPVPPVAVQTVADSEPEYKAAYLNNPPPDYPLLARRNGMQGRVVLNVEVLANGLCGQVSVYASSGYALLDMAALRTVKSWRFMPARHGGHMVDKWFMIPVQYSLKDTAA